MTSKEDSALFCQNFYDMCFSIQRLDNCFQICFWWLLITSLFSWLIELSFLLQFLFGAFVDLFTFSLIFPLATENCYLYALDLKKICVWNIYIFLIWKIKLLEVEAEMTSGSKSVVSEWATW